MWKRALMALSLAALVASPASAQPPEPPDTRATPEAREAKKREKFGRLLREGAGFDEATAQRIERIARTFEPQHRQLRDQRQAAWRQLEALLDADSDDQNAYRRALDQYASAMQAEHQLMQREIDAIRGALTPKEQARLLRAMHAGKKGKHDRGRGGDRPERTSPTR